MKINKFNRSATAASNEEISEEKNEEKVQLNMPILFYHIK